MAINKSNRVEQGTANAGDNGILYEAHQLERYEKHFIHNNGAGQDLDVDITFDGTNYDTAVPLVDLNGVALASDEVPTGNTGVLIAKIEGMRVRNKGGTTSADCVVTHVLPV